MNKKIDIVILWVDGNDPEWIKEKEKYTPKIKNSDNNAAHRYRDWDNLQYWFRSVEKNAGWVNNIFFITWGHVPKWLNVNHPRIKIIKHSEYIPKEFLPTFNSNTIELNLHRIDELSENFILFNDDMFIISKTDEGDFFKNNLPVELYSENVNSSIKANSIYNHNMLNNMCILNKYFNKHKMYKRHLFKYINFKYGFKANLSTILLMPFGHYSMILDQHIPVSLNKSTLKEIWDKEEELLTQCGKNRFRDFSDVTQYLIRYFQLCKGNFIPKSYKFGIRIDLSDDNKELEILKKHKYKTVCFNDTERVKNFDKSKETLNKYLEELFPEKSSYEL